MSIIPFGAGEVIGDAPDRRVEILSDHPALNATWSRFSAGRDGADLHIHRKHTDMFYVIEGELTVRLGPAGEEVVVPAGTLARVPPMVVHGFRNGSDAEMRYLNFHAPGMDFANYLRAMRDGREYSYDQFEPPADGGRPITEAVVGGAEHLGDGVTLHADIEAIGAAERRSAAPEAEHVHESEVESFYVLEGELALTVGGDEVSAAAGTWVQVPAGVPHAVSLSDDVRFLHVRTPNGRLAAALRA